MSNWNMDDGERGGGYVVRMAMIMAALVVVILGAVVYMNREETSGRIATSQKEKGVSHISEPDDTEDDSMKPQEHKRTSDELDIWDEDYTSVLEVTPEAEVEQEEHDITTDGNHSLITYADGTSEWVTISNRIAQNDYQDASFVYQKPIMKYYEDGKKISYMGVVLSAEQRYVDFVSLKDAGADFVMICVGRRDPGSGLLKLDSQFAQNMKNAMDEELQIGVWFASQAMTVEEAEEEAEFVLDQLLEYEVTYPVACVYEPTERKTRTDELDKKQRTEYVLTFMEQMEQAGYGVIFGANKENLILNLDLTLMEEYDIWLMQPGDVPDYPYAFSMWTYDNQGSIEGIAAETSLLISMEDLSLKEKTK